MGTVMEASSFWLAFVVLQVLRVLPEEKITASHSQMWTLRATAVIGLARLAHWRDGSMDAGEVTDPIWMMPEVHYTR